MPMNNRLLRPLQTPGLLDLVPGAAAAYSLRSLSRSYAGPVVTVRRSSDDAEEGFTASEVSDGTLAAFCGAGDGFVKIWHSQTGSNDATQTTAAYQPKIVSSGVVVTEDGRPAMQFDGSDDFLKVPSSTAAFKFLHSSQSSLFAVCSIGLSANPGVQMTIVSTSASSSANVGAFFYYEDVSANNGLGVFVSRGVTGTNACFALTANAVATQSQALLSFLTDPSTAVAASRAAGYVNGVDLGFANASTASVSTANATLDLHIGIYNTGLSGKFGGTMQELLIYPSDLTEQRELVEGLVAWGWSV